MINPNSDTLLASNTKDWSNENLRLTEDQIRQKIQKQDAELFRQRQQPEEEEFFDEKQKKKMEKDMEEGNFLQDPENLRNMMKILNQGFTTYKMVQQIPLKVLTELLKIGVSGLGINAYR
tara:strand:- start:69 stop:428 length:360 start_codon:yes stop_codon:yes gene_type:complete